MKKESDTMGRIVGGNFAAANLLTEFFDSTAPHRNPAVFLPALADLPLEVVYALNAHYHAAAFPAGSIAASADPPRGEN